MSPKSKRVLLWVVGSMGVLTLLCANMIVCVPAMITDGIYVNECPSGDPVPTLNAYVSGLGREVTGSVYVSATAHYTTSDASADWSADIHRLSADLSLVDASGKETELEPEDGWDSSGNGINAEIKLPKVPDGDYLLRIKGDTASGPATLDVPLPIYAPAKVHVLTDRPLYEPGNTVKFRALALRARDLTPLDGRPGTWTVIDPNGETVLEEKAPAGEWGVAAASFPLDTGAVSGDWTVRWTSGGTAGESRFRVEPFTLPRFRVEASSDKAAWFAGESPVLRGRVVYSSGAPVSNASLELDWRVDGDWPPPTRWMDEQADDHLPTRLTTGPNGDFTLNLPVIPADLLGQATLAARIAATDATGDRVDGSVRLLMSQDRIQASAVTELQDGLAEGFNNRMYLRVTTAAGAPLADTELRVKRAWDASDKGVLTKTDADGVASLQVDPGPAVNVLVPAAPVRPPKPPPTVERSSAVDLFAGSSPSLDDVLMLDAWTGVIEPCARFAQGSDTTVRVVLRVDRTGVVRVASPAEDDGASRCVATVARGRRLSSGEDRLISATWTLRDPGLPWMEAATTVSALSEPSGVREAMEQAALAARGCLATNTSEGDAPFFVEWRPVPGTRRLDVTFTDDPDGEVYLDAGCVQPAMRAALQRDVLDEIPEGEAARTLGFTKLEAHPARGERGEDRPQPTTMLGYEFEISALGPEGRAEGETLLRLGPGTVPPLRLRADKVLPEPGDTVNIDILRGPGFDGELPDELYLSAPEREAIKAKVDKKAKRVSFTLPADAQGWFSVGWMNAEARLFVRPRQELTVALIPERDRYAPGQEATLRLKTTAAGEPVSAGVGLFGVDESLGQLTALLGPDALDGLRATVQTPSPAFGVLDGQALSMGRIRGANAAAAAVLRVTQIPTPESLDAVVSTSANGSFTPLEALTDSFYAVLAELYAQTRTWEEGAKDGELMEPARMAALWERSVDAVKSRGGPCQDAYGRPLRLGQLPSDLLALTDPRAVVLDSTHLPEDVEDWARWVSEEQP